MPRLGKDARTCDPANGPIPRLAVAHARGRWEAGLAHGAPVLDGGRYLRPHAGINLRGRTVKRNIHEARHNVCRDRPLKGKFESSRDRVIAIQLRRESGVEKEK